jgi:bacteriorhodopsin
MENDDEELKERIQRHKISMTREKWKTRRQMAWICLSSFVFLTLCMFFYISDSRVSSLKEIYSTLSLFCLSVVGMYMGAATYFDTKDKN